ncbi:MAG: GntR family transcriptional regulator [Bifidobacteriaceae bacterium]|jgi:DNA-binding GntR family transcriptional regulator|nr:GntR family transcriptional regulator [Bifidobacteriaceae bacterium]
MSGQVQIVLDRNSPVPLYHQMATAIEAAIAGGALAPGEFLENELSLAARLQVSRPTARQALQDLVDRGLLIRKRGVGTQVAPAQIRRPVGLTSLADDLAGAGRKVETRVLSHQTVAAPADVAAALQRPQGEPLVRVERLRLADGDPIAVMVNYLPADLAPTSEELSQQGLYASLRARGASPKVAQQSIGARIATAAEARMLEEPPRSAVLTMERTAFGAEGNPIEFGSHVYRASRYRFETSLFAS